ITYRLLVMLQPPPGHSFRQEMDTTGQLPAKPSSIRVVPVCMCSREQQLGDVFCFLHHTEEQLPRTAHALYRLHTLCKGPYLDSEKISCWVHLLVRSAWLLLPQSHFMQLSVLTSSDSFRFQLTSTSKMEICIEMKLEVELA
ncbi:IPIL1 protein, partial [Geococcyx californianus]|nr:IPIL1 protein [Geococcyx californianus]